MGNFLHNLFRRKKYKFRSQVRFRYEREYVISAESESAARELAIEMFRQQTLRIFDKWNVHFDSELDGWSSNLDFDIIEYVRIEDDGTEVDCDRSMLYRYREEN